MRSTSGAYFAGLDHVRGLAALLVVIWHFTHWTGGSPVPFNQLPLLGPFDEGHVGVAVFMVLSGYLFAKLIGDRQIRFLPFLYNRALRLLPLLLVFTAVYCALFGLGVTGFLKTLALGTLLPWLPYGGWSITVEAHFYLLLPMVLFAIRRDVRWGAALIACAIALRVGLLLAGLDLQEIAYPTIIGRFDQFVLGIAAYKAGNRVTGTMALGGLLFLWVLYFWFDSIGGLTNANRPALWTVWPTLEALPVTTMIAWYDRNPLPNYWPLRKAGEYSYSIYLLHFFFANPTAMFIQTHVMDISSLPLALPWAVLFFLAMMALGHLSWKLIEEPPLRFRVPYAQSSGSLNQDNLFDREDAPKRG